MLYVLPEGISSFPPNFAWLSFFVKEAKVLHGGKLFFSCDLQKVAMEVIFVHELHTAYLGLNSTDERFAMIFRKASSNFFGIRVAKFRAKKRKLSFVILAVVILIKRDGDNFDGLFLDHYPPVQRKPLVLFGIFFRAPVSSLLLCCHLCYMTGVGIFASDIFHIQKSAR